MSYKNTYHFDDDDDDLSPHHPSPGYPQSRNRGRISDDEGVNDDADSVSSSDSFTTYRTYRTTATRKAVHTRDGDGYEGGERGGSDKLNRSNTDKFIHSILPSPGFSHEPPVPDLPMTAHASGSKHSSGGGNGPGDLSTSTSFSSFSSVLTPSASASSGAITSQSPTSSPMHHRNFSHGGEFSHSRQSPPSSSKRVQEHGGVEYHGRGSSNSVSSNSSSSSGHLRSKSQGRESLAPSRTPSPYRPGGLGRVSQLREKWKEREKLEANPSTDSREDPSRSRSNSRSHSITGEDEESVERFRHRSQYFRKVSDANSDSGGDIKRTERGETTRKPTWERERNHDSDRGRESDGERDRGRDRGRDQARERDQERYRDQERDMPSSKDQDLRSTTQRTHNRTGSGGNGMSGEKSRIMEKPRFGHLRTLSAAREDQEADEERDGGPPRREFNWNRDRARNQESQQSRDKERRRARDEGRDNEQGRERERERERNWGKDRDRDRERQREKDRDSARDRNEVWESQSGSEDSRSSEPKQPTSPRISEIIQRARRASLIEKGHISLEDAGVPGKPSRLASPTKDIFGGSDSLMDSSPLQPPPPILAFSPSGHNRSHSVGVAEDRRSDRFNRPGTPTSSSNTNTNSPTPSTPLQQAPSGALLAKEILSAPSSPRVQSFHSLPSSKPVFIVSTYPYSMLIAICFTGPDMAFRQMSAANQAEDMLLDLQVSQAAMDASSFEILGMEEVEVVRKDVATLRARVEGLTARLALESQIRAAAENLARLHAGNARLAEQAESQLAAATRKVDMVATELWKLSQRAAEAEKRLLQHTAAALVHGVRQAEIEARAGSARLTGEEGETLAETVETLETQLAEERTRNKILEDRLSSAEDDQGELRTVLQASLKEAVQEREEAKRRILEVQDAWDRDKIEKEQERVERARMEREREEGAERERRMVREKERLLELQSRLRDATEDVDGLQARARDTEEMLRGVWNRIGSSSTPSFSPSGSNSFRSIGRGGDDTDSQVPASPGVFGMEALVTKMDRIIRERGDLLDKVLSLQDRNEALSRQVDGGKEAQAAADRGRKANEQDLEQTIQNLQADLEELKGDRSRWELKVKELEKDLEAEVERRKRAERDLEDETVRRERVERDLDEAILHRGRAEEDLARRETGESGELEEMRRELSKGREMHDRMERTIRELEDDRDDLERRVREIQEDRTDLEVKVRETEEERDRQVQAAERSRDELEAKLNLTGTEGSRWEAEKLELEGKVRKTEEELRDVQRRYVEINDRLDDRGRRDREASEQASSEIDRLTRELRIAQQQERELKDDTLELRALLAKLKEEGEKREGEERQSALEEGRREGIEEGRKQGMEEGRRQGKEEGERLGREESLRSGQSKEAILLGQVKEAEQRLEETRESIAHGTMLIRAREVEAETLRSRSKDLESQVRSLEREAEEARKSAEEAEELRERLSLVKLQLVEYQTSSSGNGGSGNGGGAAKEELARVKRQLTEATEEVDLYRHNLEMYKERVLDLEGRIDVMAKGKGGDTGFLEALKAEKESAVRTAKAEGKRMTQLVEAMRRARND
ncbi:hypothetical protein BJ684DRAFT_18704 [Piptocephalis cylindrospora]|uniref:Up-regulated during septation protein 1 domain-containing protein n=1 Tax=Piptocephalis cylindrospora TaxID=1907219 RepID=A0A4P9Y822_9FUNG|nr:hypothetical protein BJ684DRAFT_18704 [Piptocephalis cylindrospora]|eukprot:RKP14932.1 hypothetical protein BJ684DRAFT_18704 [Piptocephalis cylindrospora]